MQINKYKNNLIVFLIFLLLAQFSIVTQTLGQDSSLVWDKPVVVKRVSKPTRKPVAHRRVERVPLLTLEWRMLKRNNDGTSQETNPNAIFHTGDRIRLAIKANQNVYLYIVHHSQGQDGTIIFPDSRINNGENYVKKNQEYILPAYCPTPEFDDPKDCWWKMTPPAGREEFTIICSRDMITSLPNQSSDEIGIIKLNVISELKTNSGQTLKRTSRPEFSYQEGGSGRYITWVTNTNAKDNEDLIETIVITHGS
ncbi:MAG: hypothetical protein FD167_1113 [bacterium]|nr:MAG: hypothetical protein FD167_1113 [bacterium]